MIIYIYICVLQGSHDMCSLGSFFPMFFPASASVRRLITFCSVKLPDFNQAIASGFVTFQREENMWFNDGLTIEFGRLFPLSSFFSQNFPKIESTCVCDLDSSSLFYSCLTLDINWFDIFG